MLFTVYRVVLRDIVKKESNICSQYSSDIDRTIVQKSMILHRVFSEI